MNDFKTFYDLYKGRVYFFVKKYIKDQEDAEDVVQDVFVHIWKYDSYKNEGSILDQIVFKTAKQEISNYYRKHKMIMVTEDFFSETAQAEEAENDFALGNLSKIQHLLSKLPQITRDIFVKNKVEQISYSILAKEYNLSKSTIENHVKKAMRFIKNNMSVLFTITFILSKFLKKFLSQ